MPSLLDVRVAQCTRVLPPAYGNVTFSPGADTLWGFDANKHPIAVQVGSGLDLTSGVLSLDASALDAATLEGKTWEAPGTIGSTTPNTGAFTTLTTQDLLIKKATLNVLATDDATYSTWQGGLTDRGFYVQRDTGNAGFYAGRVGSGLGFGATAFTGTVAGGTWAAKTGTPANAGTVFRLEGWDTTAWFQSNGYLAITAQETWSATGHGTRIALYQTRIGDTVGKEVLVFDATTTLAPNIRTTSPAAATASITFAVPNDTGLAATYESFGVQFQAATRKWADGTVAIQREYAFGAPTYNKTTTAATFTKAATVAITGAPTAGTGVTITNSYALWVQSGKSQFDGILAISDTTETSSYTTGSVQIAGGVGIAKTLLARAVLVGDGTSALNTLIVRGRSTADALLLGTQATNQVWIGDNGAPGVGSYGVASGDAYIGTITGGGFAMIAGGALAFTAYNTAGGTRVDFVNPMRIANMPSYASNAAAISGGLLTGDLYRNGDNLCIVH